jgi:hypothetical protein
VRKKLQKKKSLDKKKVSKTKGKDENETMKLK